MKGEDVMTAGSQQANGIGSDASGRSDLPQPAEQVSVEDLVARYHRAVYAYAYRLTGRVQDAEDLTQQTFLVAHTKLDQLREAARAKAWLLAIARSQYCRLCRKKRPFLADDADIELDAVPGASENDGPVDSEKLQMVLSRMTPPFRTVILMYYMEQLSYREIAEQLGVPIGTVMSRLARAKARLRSVLGSEIS